MPVQYPTGITAEHKAVREAAGLFDVSHMGEFVVTGPQALDLIQHVTVNDASKIDVGQAQYSAMCLESGGVIDDLLDLPVRGPLHVGGQRVEPGEGSGLDPAPRRRPSTSMSRTASDGTALLALQGPAAREILRPLVDIDVDDVAYYHFAEGTVAGVRSVIAGTGYTGEDGFELYVDAEDAAGLWRAILDEGEESGLMPAGLGARDSLRLEMGYALYGNDLDEEHTPLESGLGWITKLDKGDFVGREVLVRQKEEGLARRLVGLKLTDRGFPRPGYEVLHDGEAVGIVTSGTVSP